MERARKHERLLWPSPSGWAFSEVDAVRQARADELGHDRQEPEGEGRKKALMLARPLHDRIIRVARGQAKLRSASDGERRRAHRQPMSVSV